jgi:hypothetical protein
MTEPEWAGVSSSATSANGDTNGPRQAGDTSGTTERENVRGASVLVDVVAVLVVAVPVVQVIHVVAVLDSLATVALGVGAVVASMYGLFGVTLGAMDVVEVVAVLDGLAAIAGEMLVVGRDRVFGHHSSGYRTAPVPEIPPAIPGRQGSVANAQHGSLARPGQKVVTVRDAPAGRRDRTDVDRASCGKSGIPAGFAHLPPRPGDAFPVDVCAAQMFRHRLEVTVDHAHVYGDAVPATALPGSLGCA